MSAQAPSLPDAKDRSNRDDDDSASDLPEEHIGIGPQNNPDFDVQVHDDLDVQDEKDEKKKPKLSSPRKKAPQKAAASTNETNTEKEETVLPKVLGRKHRQGRLVLRRATVENESEIDAAMTARRRNSSAFLPLGQYETILVRRALHQTDDGGTGDTSLGMKLNVMGGKVIVKALSTLADGRASPAQLTGRIQPGDVLLQINDTSLVNLPIDRLMKALAPLSTPDETTGQYAQNLRMRLARGKGLRLLQQADEPSKSPASMQYPTAVGLATDSSISRIGVDPAVEMFSIFPMGDVLPPVIPTPTSPPHTLSPEPETGHDSSPTKESSSLPPNTPTAPADTNTPLTLSTANLEERIARKLAEERLYERRQIISNFFAQQAALRWSLGDIDGSESDATGGILSPSEMMDLGSQALRGAKALSAIMERVDKGSDRRSFHSLTATLSLYSRASTRRRYVLDGRAMPVHFDKVQEDTVNEEEDNNDGDDKADENYKEDTSVGSTESNSDDGEQLDGDELLLQLAATDEIWRKQVLDFLEHVIEQSEEDTSEESTQLEGNIDLSNELGSFLFGTNMNEVLKRKRKSHALPPPEITSLLFDLTTKISSTVPDRIKAEGDPITVRSSIVPFIGMKRPSDDSNIMLANHFLLDQVLPLWLKAFRPLPLEQRRILWPRERSQNMESTAGSSTLSGDDNLTLDSMQTKTTGGGSRTRKNLREQIEDVELDPESRAETCFLTTYFFSQHLLPRLLGKGKDQVDSTMLEEILDFAAKYGAYLKLHTCLAYAAVLKSSNLIESLLEVAKFDPRHREVMKQTVKPSALVIYDSTMLSTVMQRLKDIDISATPERQRATINLCYQAYPDLRPWQVKQECIEGAATSSTGDDNLAELYYRYLCLLLHPTDGHEGARHDKTLVQEYCALSIARKEGDTKRRIRNFLHVASKTSSNHLAYVRDLPVLLKLSMDAGESNLALDLAAEILDTNTNLHSTDSLQTLVGYVTDIGRSSVDSFLADRDNGSRILKRILRLYNRLAALSTTAAKSVISIPLELIALLEHAENRSKTEKGLIELIGFFALEARPETVLEALVRWCHPDDVDNRLYPVYQALLIEGARKSASMETSGALYRVVQAHSKFEETVQTNQDTVDRELMEEYGSLWTQVSLGNVLLDK